MKKTTHIYLEGNDLNKQVQLLDSNPSGAMESNIHLNSLSSQYAAEVAILKTGICGLRSKIKI